jgi:hypothetical protein
MSILASTQALSINDDMRKLRIAGDVELSRRWPGWYCVLFHYGQFVECDNRWLLVYSVQMTEHAEPNVCRVLMGKVKMADGSWVWGAP